MSKRVWLAGVAAVLTIATLQGGLRYNIIPEDMTMTGTLRTFDPGMRTDVMARAAQGRVADDIDYIMGAEDFSYFQKEVPGFFNHLGVGYPKGGNHSPFFDVDAKAMETGVRAQALLALDYLAAK